MKTRLYSATITLGVMLACGGAYAAGGPGDGAQLVLDPYESATLIYMREEEKLARDVYGEMYGQWGTKVFLNISDSEQNHMDAMLKMLEKYAIPDPIVSDTAGVFGDATLSALYPDLIDRSEDSLLEAFLVGGYVEEMGIRDLQSALAETDEYALTNAYTNLLAAERNHLRTLVSHVTNLGVDYVAQLLPQGDVDEIVGDYDLTPPQGFTINAGLNDAWFFPGTNGQGFFLTVFPGRQRIFMGWFTYDTTPPDEAIAANLGDPGHRWMTAQGSYAGAQAELMVDIASGGLFDSSEAPVVHEAAGSVLLQFDDCASGSLYYDLPSIGQTGLVPIQRLCNDNVPLCEQLSASEPQ